LNSKNKNKYRQNKGAGRLGEVYLDQNPITQPPTAIIPPQLFYVVFPKKKAYVRGLYAEGA